MKFSLPLKLHLQIALALLAGLLNVLIFPRPAWPLLSWICLVPLMLAGYQEQKSWRALLLGWLAGLAFFCGNCYWIVSVLVNYGGLDRTGAILSFLLLAAYLALFYGLFLLLSSRVTRQYPTAWGWVVPFVWVATEYLRTCLLTGFPWCLLGYALVDYSHLIQLASWTGVYGLSFLVVLVNALFLDLALKRSKRTIWQCATVVLILLLGSGMAAWRLPASGAASMPVRILQTNLYPEQDWLGDFKDKIIGEFVRLSLPPDKGSGSAASPPNMAGLLVWPETPAPFYYNHDLEFQAAMRGLARRSGRYVLFGFVDLRPSAQQASPDDPFNSVALLSPRGELISQYDKMHLVPFGEYIPYPRLFFFVNKISTEAGNFVPGNHLVVSPIDSGHRLGTFVCYEAVFPGLVRRFSRDGAQLLVNVTNDGWFGGSIAPLQHLAMARFRAVENHRYLIRAANNGVSAIIDPQGNLVRQTPLDKRMVLDGSVAFLGDMTFYTRYGDVFAWLACALSLFVAGHSWRRLRKK